MSRWMLASICTLLLGACDAERPADKVSQSTGAKNHRIEPTPAPATSVHFDGYAATRFGMDEQAFRAAWNGELDAPQTSARGSCYYLWPTGVAVPADFAFMFENGRFVRYDISNAERTAPGGGRVGMHASEIRTRYPKLTEASHKYVEGGQYLRVEDPFGTDSALVFETDAEGIVTGWRIGVPPQVDYVEGCS